MSKKIPIVLYYPGKWAYKANVMPSARIGDLKKLLPDLKVNFVLNGVILNEEMSFGFYYVKANDVMIVVNKCDYANKKNKFATYSNENESFTESVFNIINPKTSKESVRIRDIQLAKLDRKPKVFRKVVKTQLEYFNQSPAKQCIPSIIPSKSSVPSVEPLPCFWSKKKALLRRGKDNTNEVVSEISSPKPEQTENEDSIVKP